MSKKNHGHVSPNSGRVEDRDETTVVHEPVEGGEIVKAAMVETPKHEPATKVPTQKAVEALRAEYESLNTQVGDAAKHGLVYEQELLKEVKVKVQAHAGDVGALKAQKLAAFTAWETAHRAREDAVQRELEAGK